MFRQISKDQFSKNSKTKKLPPKTPKNQKSKKECSSELMLKTKNVQTYNISKDQYSNNSKVYQSVSPFKTLHYSYKEWSMEIS